MVEAQTVLRQFFLPPVCDWISRRALNFRNEREENFYSSVYFWVWIFYEDPVLLL